MAKLALYQKYRSSTFEEVVGQEYIVRSIQNAVRENKTGHAYLFCGPRGTGKTTMARLLAKAVNCTNASEAPCGRCDNCLAAMNGTHPDIVEINAANETHVEDIRELIDRSSLAPMMGRHKIYIIDEVHQLSSAASSALLKTLEEPPENVIFVLATTDPQKLLPTIISRCQRFDFTKVRIDQIQNHLLHIAEKENIEMEETAAEMIAELSDGGMRDALSIMDQCASFTSDHITVDAIDRIYGLATVEEKTDLIKEIVNSDFSALLTRIRTYEKRGIDLQRFSDGMIDILKDVMIYQNTKKAELLKVLDEEQASDLTGILTTYRCMQMCDALLEMKGRFRVTSNASMIFEVTCLAMTSLADTKETVTVNSTAAVNPSPVSQERKFIPPVTEKKEEPQVHFEDTSSDDLTTDQILSILVQCDKASKAHMEEVFRNFHTKAGIENRKYTAMLGQTKIAAAGKDCILLSSAEQTTVHRINDEVMNKELYFFMKNIMQEDVMLYAVTDTAFQEAAKAFVQARKNNTLPERMNIQKYEETRVYEETPEDKVKKLFGDENVKIMD